MKSVWQDTARLSRFPQLKKDIRTDVLIIGGGIAGIFSCSAAEVIARGTRAATGMNYVSLPKGFIPKRPNNTAGRRRTA